MKRSLRPRRLVVLWCVVLWVVVTWPGVASVGELGSQWNAPEPPADLGLLDEPVRAQYRERVEVLDGLGPSQDGSSEALAAAVGALGQWYDAYEYRARAALCYEQAARLDASGDRWLYHLGHVRYQRGELELARAAFEQAYGRNETRAGTALWLSRISADLGRLEDALAHGRRARELAPGAFGVEVQMAKLLLGQGSYEQARDALLALLAHPEVDSTVHHLLGMSYRGLGDIERAREHLLAASEMPTVSPRSKDPVLRVVEELIDGSKARTRRGEWLFAQGRHHEAVIELSRAREANPSDPSLWANHATALLTAGRVDEARASLEDLVSAHPGFAGGHAALGMVLTVSGEAQLARASYARALDVDGRSLEALDGMATLDILGGDYLGASSRYRRIVALDPTNARAHYRGIISAILGARPKEAVALTKTALSLVPDVEPLRLLAARTLACLDSQGAGLRRARELVAGQSPDPVFTLESRAMVAAASGQAEEAVAVQQKVLERATDATRERVARRLEHYGTAQGCLSVFEAGEFAL